MGERQRVGTAHVQCAECPEVIDVPVLAEIVDEQNGVQSVVTTSDTTLLWRHYEIHAFPGSGAVSSFAVETNHEEHGLGWFFSEDALEQYSNRIANEHGAKVLLAAAQWLENQRAYSKYESERRIPNYASAAKDLRALAEKVQSGEKI